MNYNPEDILLSNFKTLGAVKKQNKLHALWHIYKASNMIHQGCEICFKENKEERLLSGKDSFTCTKVICIGMLCI